MSSYHNVAGDAFWSLAQDGFHFSFFYTNAHDDYNSDSIGFRLVRKKEKL